MPQMFKSIFMRISMLCMLCFSFPMTAFAQSEPPKIDTGDTAWLLVATTVVLFMFLPGLALFYSGLLSRKNVLSTIMQSTGSLIVVSIVWVLWGHTLTFGTDQFGIIGGLDFLFFEGVGMDPFSTLTFPHLIFAIFQALFAAITVALISGAVAERIKFSVWIVFSIFWVTFIYTPFAHWVWGGGWLFKLGGLDFAGGTVVHILSGVSAITAAIVLGPRKLFPGKTLPPHNIVFFFIGAMCLWFGWMGFNGGSALAAGGLATLAFANTHMAACAGGAGWALIEWIFHKKPTLVGTVTGIIAGLVAITPAAGFVPVLSAMAIGGSASFVCYWAVNTLKAKFKYDDALDVFGIHGVGGIWGALLTGVFASKEVNPSGNNGLLYGNPSQLVIQAIDILIAIGWAAAGTLVILKTIQLFTTLRVPAEEEEAGLDISHHGEHAYNELESGRSEMAAPSFASFEIEKSPITQTN
ncbi:ammonium transporter [Paenibacillus validus]